MKSFMLLDGSMLDENVSSSFSSSSSFFGKVQAEHEDE
jgi:hypothetical protein